MSPRVFRLAFCIVCACACAVACLPAAAGQSSLVPPKPTHANAQLLSTAELERVFWACDYAAGTRGVLAKPVATCSAVFDDLKDARFGGDFDALVTWWRANKDTEHRRIAETRQAAERTATR